MQSPPLGSMGRALTVLNPAGNVEFHGTSYPARSEHGEIGAGSHVVLSGFDPWCLFVREIAPELAAEAARSARPKRPRASILPAFLLRSRLVCVGCLVAAVSLPMAGLAIYHQHTREVAIENNRILQLWVEEEKARNMFGALTPLSPAAMELQRNSKPLVLIEPEIPIAASVCFGASAFFAAAGLVSLRHVLRSAATR